MKSWPTGLWGYLFWFVIGCWVLFFLTFVLRKKAPQAKEAKSAPVSRIGIILQGCAFAIVWAIRRVPSNSAIISVHPVVDWLLVMLTVVFSAGSVWMVLSAVRALGKQWSVAARLVEGHELVTAGPYQIIRNPIYAGMFGMMIATGLVLSHWTALVCAMAIFLVGTIIRIRAEEKLLREAFGAKFDEYTQRVSALIPGVY